MKYLNNSLLKELQNSPVFDLHHKYKVAELYNHLPLINEVHYFPLILQHFSKKQIDIDVEAEQQLREAGHPIDYSKELTGLNPEFNAILISIEKQTLGGTLTDRVALNNIFVGKELTELTDVMNNYAKSFASKDEHTNLVRNVQAFAQDFLDIMHKYNASTDLGTVKYLDNFAKSDATRFMCIKTENMETKYNAEYSNFSERAKSAKGTRNKMN